MVSAFLDTSALFAGVWSSEGGARMILRLGEAGAIRIAISPRVLAEVEGVLRRKAPEALGALALILDRSQGEVVPEAPSDRVNDCYALTGHAGDAEIIAAAWQAAVDYFVTLDREHFLNNAAVRGAVPFPLGTPGDFLAWYRGRLTYSTSRE